MCAFVHALFGSFCYILTNRKAHDLNEFHNLMDMGVSVSFPLPNRTKEINLTENNPTNGFSVCNHFFRGSFAPKNITKTLKHIHFQLKNNKIYVTIIRGYYFYSIYDQNPFL